MNLLIFQSLPGAPNLIIDKFNASIEFENVSFAYHSKGPGNRDVLGKNICDGLSFKVSFFPFRTIFSAPFSRLFAEVDYYDSAVCGPADH